MTASRAAAKVWNGAPAIRRFLVPIESLEPFPGNPNKGDVEAVRASLHRFGQVRAIIVDGSRIVAGHTTTEAATAEGWTHIAATPNEFGSEEEARAYLIADNRTAALGAIDEEALAVQLDAIRDNYAGTGFTAADKAELDARLELLRNPHFEPSDEPPPALDERSAGTTGLFEAPLLLGRDVREDFARHVRMLRNEWGLEDMTSVVVRAVREAAASL